jgi:aryl-alcohol dehydrogenase-like predicted oxidoreductase
METRTIGSLKVSLVGLGCNNFGSRNSEDESKDVVHAALDAGITLFDTADMYGNTRSEQFLGTALGSRRDEVVIATKFGGQLKAEGSGGGSAAWVRTAAEDSLRRLGTDVIDLYQLHFPDPNVPIEETLGAMNELVQAGKVREIGCSNFIGQMMDEAAEVSKSRGFASFVSVQNHVSLLHQDDLADDLLPGADRHGLAILPYFPLANGLLTGKYHRNEEFPEGTRIANMPEAWRSKVVTDDAFAAVARLDTWARDHGHTLLELAFAWLAAFPQVPSVIAGATRPEQVKANVEAMTWKLTPAERDEAGALALSAG